MDRNRQDPSGSIGGSKDGRPTENILQIDWQDRAKVIWELHPNLKRTIGELHEMAQSLDSRTIGLYEDFRRKFNGTRAASEAHARLLFAAGQFDRAGLTFAEWIAGDEEWAATAATLSPIDAVGFLAERAAEGTMQVVPSSTPQRIQPAWRRLRDGDPAEIELHIGEYLEFTVTFPGSDDPSPVHLLAFEWSSVLRDWQVFNLVKECRLDAARPVPLATRAGGVAAQVPVGVQISGPTGTFDLFVLGQRTPFNHRARSMLDSFKGRSEINSIEMSRLLALLFSGPVAPAVAGATYAVV